MVRFRFTQQRTKLSIGAGLIGLGLLAAACSSAAHSATPAADVGLGTPVSPAELATQPVTATRPPPNVNGPAVTIDNFNFTPATITVSAGTTVTWVNRDDVPHTVTASDKSFSSQSIDTDGQFSQKFDTPGTYSYFCAIHPFMTAKVVVQ